jgi:hypothetical protein
MNAEYLDAYRDRDSALQILKILSKEENTREALAFYQDQVLELLSFGLRRANPAFFSIWNSDLVVYGHSQRNSKPPASTSTGFWGVSNPSDPRYLHGSGLNGEDGFYNPGIGARIYGSVHSDSMFNVRAVSGSGMPVYNPWAGLEMQQHDVRVVTKVARFINETFDMTAVDNKGRGIFQNVAGGPEKFVVDLSEKHGHSLGNR